ncbi:MAG: hypothetical protein KIS66_06945 [Fimbriimonadaceae bacterium]|nr:hypothetical protein [Fimbriimonadaceae bacterium]
MPVTNYHTVNGRTIGETTDGVRTDYLTDALGSVTATVDQSQNVLNTYRYKPYGGLLAKTGSSPDPRFLWTGDTGSRTTGLAYSEQYNRARHYGSMQANWTSVDPGNGPVLAYQYANCAPSQVLDPSGLVSVTVNAFIHKAQDYRARYVTDCTGKTSGGWVHAPPNFSGLSYYRGDRRDFLLDEPYGKTSRTHSNIVASNCSIGNLDISNVSLRARADRTQGMVSDPVFGPCFRYLNPIPAVNIPYFRVTNLGRDQRSGISLVEFAFMTRDPLVLFSPHLRADVRIWLIMNFCSGELSVIANVRHTRYPWFEVYARTEGASHWVAKHAAMVDDLVLGLQVMTDTMGMTQFRAERCRACCA